MLNAADLRMFINVATPKPIVIHSIIIVRFIGDSQSFTTEGTLSNAIEQTI
jgi:hypothetical protein